MAQVKFKHGTVQNARHIVRDLLSTARKMLRTVDVSDAGEKDTERIQSAYTSLRQSTSSLQGAPGYTKEEQTERLTATYGSLGDARKDIAALLKSRKGTHAGNMLESVIGMIDEARQHLTASKQFAKDRTFVPKHEEQPEPGVEDDEPTSEDDDEPDADIAVLVKGDDDTL